MRCCYCDKKAEYIMAGFSVCEEHTNRISIWEIPSCKEFKKSPLHIRNLNQGGGKQ